ncbi:hypothetical protein TGAM01_v211006 [Trichoderma gamsii]|uniref:Uncharacterized protein n=1 Tax=Trichoderma gamsii TaxID=398673 RepID=A0A2P4Z743_9HYPO|nr:hypothetical protein TGAM01_v211006 [Trichoderma gamsii]PON20111.1 hypothetical protein TGAM01_v211006 [Trichoderma gamsii]
MHSHQEVKAALEATKDVDQTFCLSVNNVILVFSASQYEHTMHCHKVLQMLEDRSMRININDCVFNSKNSIDAGIQLEQVGHHKIYMVMNKGVQGRCELQSVIGFYYYSIGARVTINDPQSVELPADYSQPLGCLESFQGYSCNACRFLTINKKNAITHRTQSGHRFSPGETGWKSVTLQTFSRGAHARYWIVDAIGQPIDAISDSNGNDADDDGNDDVTALTKMAEVCEQGILEEDKKRRQLVEAPGGVNTDSRWVKFMKLAQHLKDKNRKMLYETAAPLAPKAVEKRWNHQEAIKANRRLRQLGDSYDRVLARCTALAFGVMV